MSGSQKASALKIIALLFCVAMLPPLLLRAESSVGVASQADPATQAGDAAGSSLFLKVRFDSAVKPAALKPGESIEGTLVRGVYSGDRELFPAATRVRLTVDTLQRRRRPPNDHWPWVVKAFAPRYEKFPTFQSAVVLLPHGQVPLRVWLLSFNREVQVHARGKSSRSGDKLPEAASEAPKPSPPVPPASQSSGVVATLQAAIAGGPSPLPEISPAAHSDSLDHGGAEVAAPSSPLILPAGTEARVILLGDVSASRSHPGDSLRARLVEPVSLGSTIVLPEGTLLEGRVVKSARPRTLSRAGSLLLAFTGITLPGKTETSVAASLTGVVLDSRSHTRVDPEGDLRGDRPGKAWMLLNAGAAGGMAKAADDGTQLVIEAIVSTATDASTAGTARIAATCISGIFLLTRHGRDVMLPKFTEMNIVFNRPVSVLVAQTPQPAGAN